MCRCYSITILIIFFLISHIVIIAQDEKPKYWISFSDKNNTPYNIDSPSEFLSERSIARRLQQNIAIIEEDLPVDPQYIIDLTNLGMQVINTSKWFNGAIVSSNDYELLDTLENYNFIKSEPILIKPALNDKSLKNKESKKIVLNIYPTYGYSSKQIKMLNGEYLHRANFEGQGMLIAVQDAGFTNADKISSLQHIWDEGRVVAKRDFVKDNLGFFESHRHGTLVFSIIGGIIEDAIYGTATQANYALIRTEDGNSEYIIEEYNWVCGAEFADSLGVDIMNSSLGYSLFDDSQQNHTYSDMDGQTTPVSIGADIAVSKGMIVVASAGNSGNNTWFRIIAPGDAFNVITVGAVDSGQLIASFSSRGPSYDRRVKPDISAQGVGTVAQSPNGDVTLCNGTSCSAPLISGMLACLWQANPHATAMQIIESIRESSSQYEDPDSLYGYGIPDFFIANRYLSGVKPPPENNIVTYNLFPNPVSNYFYLEILRPLDASDGTVLISYHDVLGNIAKKEEREIIGSHSMLEFENIESLTTGMYFLKIEFPGGVHTLPFMKIK